MSVVVQIEWNPLESVHLRMSGQAGDPPLAEDDFKTAEPRARGREGRGHGHRGPGSAAAERRSELAPHKRQIDALDSQEFEFWKLKVDPDHTAMVTCGDGNGRAVCQKAIDYTAFPLPEYPWRRRDAWPTILH